MAELKRQVGLGTATSVVVANMIGTGIFTTTGLMLTEVRSGWLVLLAWAAGGAIALAGALSYAELATMMPRAGGEYAYLREIYGDLPAFLTGWVSFFVGFSAPIAASAVACAIYLRSAGLLKESVWVERGVATTIVAALTAVHFCGVKLGARVQNALTGLKVALLAGLIGAGFAAGAGNWKWLSAASGFWSEGQPGRMGIVLLWVMFAYSGWNAAAYIGEEVEDPARVLPRSLLLGTLIVMCLYLLLNVLFLYAAPTAKLEGKVAVGEVAGRQLFGAGAGAWLAGLIALTLLSSVSAYILIGPRVYYAMARDGMFFRWAAQIHPRLETPAMAIAAQGTCAAAMIWSGTFDQLLAYIGFALGIFPLLTVAGVMVLRRREPGRERPYRVQGYPLVPLFYLGAMTTVLGIALVNRPGPPLVALGTVAAGGVVYWWLKEKERIGEKSKKSEVKL